MLVLSLPEVAELELEELLGESVSLGAALAIAVPVVVAAPLVSAVDVVLIWNALVDDGVSNGTNTVCI